MISYWLPTVLHLSGFTPAGAVFAASMQAAGGIIGTLMLGALSLRFGASRVISISLAGGVLMIGAIGLLDMPYFLLLAAIFCMGSCTVGSQTAANGMVAALYPARVRTTGMGWALGIGRLGGDRRSGARRVVARPGLAATPDTAVRLRHRVDRHDMHHAAAAAGTAARAGTDPAADMMRTIVVIYGGST